MWNRTSCHNFVKLHDNVPIWYDESPIRVQAARLGKYKKDEPQGAGMSRILVVDDDVAARSAIKIVLEQDGHEVTLASNGRAGVTAATQETFDLVICDIFMPGMDGIESIHTFHQISPDIPVIAMSGFMFRDGQSPAPDYLSLSTKLGAARSLRKPFRPHELLKAVHECVSNAAAPDLKQVG